MVYSHSKDNTKEQYSLCAHLPRSFGIDAAWPHGAGTSRKTPPDHIRLQLVDSELLKQRQRRKKLWFEVLLTKYFGALSRSRRGFYLSLMETWVLQTIPPLSTISMLEWTEYPPKEVLLYLTVNYVNSDELYRRWNALVPPGTIVEIWEERWEKSISKCYCSWLDTEGMDMVELDVESY
jgi:hypothetical protein